MYSIKRVVNGRVEEYSAPDLNGAHDMAVTVRTGVRQVSTIVDIYAPDGVFIMGWEYDGTGWNAYVEGSDDAAE